MTRYLNTLVAQRRRLPCGPDVHPLNLYFFTFLLGLALAGCSSTAAAEEREGPRLFVGCVESLVERLEAIRSEFPEFRANEVGVLLSYALAVRDDDGDFLESSGLSDRERTAGLLAVCSLADDVGAVFSELDHPHRLEAQAEYLWAGMWREFERGLLQ